MTEELQERLISYLETLEGAVSSTSGFVIEQAPMYVQEIIRWQIAEGIIMSSIFLVGALLAQVPNATFLRKWRRFGGDGIKDAGWGFGAVSILVTCGCISVGSTFVCLAAKAYIAPRIVILEHIQGLL